MEELRKDMPIFIDDGHRKIRIEYEKLVCVSADGDYCTMLFATGKKYELAYNLKEIEAVLASRPFVRVSKSNIINIHCIQEICGKSIILHTDKASLAIRMGCDKYSHALEGRIQVLKKKR